MTASPRVSVLIPSWESGPWVGDAIRSALEQDFEDLEVVVVDDGSTDDTRAVLESFGSRIRFESTAHAGANAARNRLLELARGEWLQYLDADDLLLPGKLARQLAAAGEDVDLIASPCLNDAGEVRRAPVDGDPWTSFLGARLGVTSSLLFRAARVRAVGGWDPRLRAGQEQALVRALLADGARVAIVPEALCVKRHVNPRSLWRSIWRDDPKAAREADLTGVSLAVRHLAGAGQLDARRRGAAGARFLRIAEGVWRRGEDWEGVLRAAQELGLGSRDLLSESPASQRLAHVMLGFSRAQALHARRRAFVRDLKRRARRGGRALARTPRRVLARLRGGAGAPR